MYDSFYGWYLKCQSDTQTLAVIPAIHSAGRKRTCSIQIITDNDAWTVTFTIDVFRRTKGDMVRTIHESASCRAFYRFCKKGCTLFAFETDRASFEFEFMI